MVLVVKLLSVVLVDPVEDLEVCCTEVLVVALGFGLERGASIFGMLVSGSG